jgi:hypothetical protein
LYPPYRRVYDCPKVDPLSSINVIFEASTSINMINTIFWSVTPYSLVSIFQPSGRNITSVEITGHKVPEEIFRNSSNYVQHYC